MKPLTHAVILIAVAFFSNAQNNESQREDLKINPNQGIQSKSVSGNPNNYLITKDRGSYGQKSDGVNRNEDTIRRRRELTSRDSLRLNGFKRINHPVAVNPSDEIKDKKTQVSPTPKRVKNVANSNVSAEKEYVKLPELDQVIAQYQENQKEIKLAKSKNDLNTLEDLEKKSTSIKSNYVSIYKSIDSNNLNPEYRRFYEDFEKDILNK